MTVSIPDAVLDAYALREAQLTAITSGWINRTVLVERGSERSVLQCLHPVFSGVVNEDIDAITRHLTRRNVAVPLVVPTVDGALFVDALVDGSAPRAWRMLTFLPGRTISALDSPRLARSAGALVGRFHEALTDLEHTFAFTRPGAHDTRAHLDELQTARRLEVAERDSVDRLADAILAYELPPIPELPTRIVHGDLKATNLLFEGDSAVALIDLDTLAHGTMAVELGDALRSWCNPTDESDVDARFDRVTFEAALTGYADYARRFFRDEEARSLVGGTETLAIELACRFCADVYEDRYFGFDASRYPTRRAHNLARTRAQLSLARSIREQRGRLDAIVERLFLR